MTNLEFALEYLKKGISVMPLWSPKMVKKNPEWFNKRVQEALQRDSKTDFLRSVK